jgi:hypothetical protein
MPFSIDTVGSGSFHPDRASRLATAGKEMECGTPASCQPHPGIIVPAKIYRHDEDRALCAIIY